MENEVARLIRMNLDFHNLNRGAEKNLGLSLVQYHLLVTLRDMPGSSPRKLASEAGMHPSTLTQSLRRLLRKDAVYIAEDPKDSRKKILSLTRDGLALIARFDLGIGELLQRKVSL